MHERLTNRYDFGGVIVLDTGLHVGGGAGGQAVRTDSPVYRDPFGRPLIPGSSMKGAFRSTVERLAQGLPSVRVCGSPLFLLPQELVCVGANRIRAKKEELEGRAPEEVGDADEEFYLWLLDDDEGLCDSCRLFGHPELAGRAFFADLGLSPNQPEPGFELRDGVAIDRDSGRAVPRLKYDFEVVPAGTRFDFSLMVENGVKEDLGLIAVGLRELEDGMIPLGGIKSRGLGRCHLEALKIRSIDFTNRQELLEYTTRRRMKDVADPKSQLTAWIEAII